MSEHRSMNPYAPPATIEDPRASDTLMDGLVWRDGDLMVIRSGAALPPKCFVTGSTTSCSVTVEQVWQPKWVNLWLLAGILPYFFVSPYYSRSAKLTVPISRATFESHLRRVNIGFAMLPVGGLLAIASWVGGQLPAVASVGLLFSGVSTAAIGFVISSRQPISLQIVSLNGDLLILKNVHPDCLNGLPDAREID